MKFPYLHDVEIEREAAMLLHSFEQGYGEVKNAVPIEELMENHLKLALEIIDEDTDILGCININQRKVYINEAIYPEDIKKKAGRYNFTLGHEVAHWILHAPIVLDSQKNASLFDETKQGDEVIMCRDSHKKDMIESQADSFSSSLLMPKHLVFRRWEEFTGNKRPLFAWRVAASIPQKASRRIGEPLMDEKTCLEIWAKKNYFVDVFNVSAQAMVIRLKQLGLLIEDHRNEQFAF